MQNNVYECINISNVINKLHLRKTNRIGNYIYVTCPFCQSSQEKNGYMKVNTINNLYICDNCESSGTSIELYAKIKYISMIFRTYIITQLKTNLIEIWFILNF